MSTGLERRTNPPPARFVAGVLASTAMAVLASCGGSGEGPVIARVGAHAITRGALVRRMAEIATEGIVPDPPRYRACIAHEETLSPEPVKSQLEDECRRGYRTLRRHAIESLISSDWLLGEARRRGLPAPTAQRAAANIRRSLIEHEPKITQAEIAAYYHEHIPRFENLEHRYFMVLETYTSSAAARRAMRHGGLREVEQNGNRELLDRSSLEHPIPTRRALIDAVFAAKLNVLAGPAPLFARYCLLVVTKIVPTTRQSLPQAERAIRRQLEAGQRHRTLVRFVQAWRRRWTAETTCQPGYVVQKCRNYLGARVPEAGDSLS
ncbi:MAG TPA: peptidylprolyl isomerase [Solirubrobacteraceae bacterium]|nr:peptidylprolyl isomerase [Solirubrobacteraceae bacterium]